MGFSLILLIEKKQKRNCESASNGFLGLPETFQVLYISFIRNTGESGIYFVDERSEELYGISPNPLDSWINRFGSHIAPSDQKRWTDSIEYVIRRNAPWEFEGQYIFSQNEERYIRVISQPIILPEETIWNGLILDITEYWKAEEALRKSLFNEIRYHSFLRIPVTGC